LTVLLGVRRKKESHDDVRQLASLLFKALFSALILGVLVCSAGVALFSGEARSDSMRIGLIYQYLNEIVVVANKYMTRAAVNSVKDMKKLPFLPWFLTEAARSTLRSILSLIDYQVFSFVQDKTGLSPLMVSMIEEGSSFFGITLRQFVPKYMLPEDIFNVRTTILEVINDLYAFISKKSPEGADQRHDPWEAPSENPVRPVGSTADAQAFTGAAS
jgi:hypothetical protein